MASGVSVHFEQLLNVPCLRRKMGKTLRRAAAARGRSPPASCGAAAFTGGMTPQLGLCLRPPGGAEGTIKWRELQMGKGFQG